MSRTERYQRLRLLARKLNQQRRRQGRKLDILCNDLLGAQRGFLLRLQDLSFAAAFYRSLLGGTEVNSLLMRAGRAIRQELPGAGVAFFLRQPDGCELHVCPADEALYAEPQGPEDCLEPELVEDICKRNRPCTREDLAAMSRDADLETLNRFSLVTLPLSDLGRSLGFALLYCPLPQVLDAAQVRRVRSVLSGLAQAVRAVHAPLPSRP